jgi:hypothetical protein
LIAVPFSDLTGSLDASRHKAMITPEARIAAVDQPANWRKR